ncbi:hypothetical protein CR970_04505, partial [Candidatus Saccharibacteria bacterium]
MYSIDPKEYNSPKRTRIVLWSVLGFVLTVVLLGLVLLFSGSTPPQPGSDTLPEEEAPLAIDPPINYSNNVERRAGEQLRDFKAWLRDNNARGYIGEFGWPSDADANAWGSVADVWLSELSRSDSDLWVTAWAAGSHWGGYPLRLYQPSGDTSEGINATTPQTGRLERFWNNKQHLGEYGLNLAGMEFGDSASAANPGIAGQDYFYEPNETFAYLASRGVHIVRLPFKWERIQPELYGPLDTNQVNQITAMLDAADANDIHIILDLHNYGIYDSGAGRVYRLGDADFGADALVNVWSAIDASFGSHAAVIAYDIMNEPHDLPPNGDKAAAAKKWEKISQQVLTSLRGGGYEGLIMIPGYDWSSTARWRANHPNGWIDDPLNNFRYEAHHYWDADGSGKYEKSFAEEQR